MMAVAALAIAWRTLLTPLAVDMSRESYRSE